MERIRAFIRAMIGPVPVCHEYFLILHVSPKRHVVISVFSKWYCSSFAGRHVKSGRIVFGPKPLRQCIDWVKSELDNHERI